MNKKYERQNDIVITWAKFREQFYKKLREITKKVAAESP